MCARLALMWHMHQPCYVDPATGGYRMPWVFLHAAKDYREMLEVALEAGAKVTFNFVPVLLDQLEDYADPQVDDNFLNLMRLDPDELTIEAEAALARQLAMLHPDHQAGRYPRLHHLYNLITSDTPPPLERGDWLDLQVLYLIAWTGELTRDHDPEIKALAEQGEGFTQEQKTRLLGRLHQLCGETAGAFAQAQRRGLIEVCASPYFHPILPLLIDIESAREALPDVPLPPMEAGFGDDAERHVKRAIARHEELFGQRPQGFWPSEGSVSGGAVKLLASHGLKWAASDEDVLAASLGYGLRGESRGALYHPWHFGGGEGEGINLFFRDKGLSDLIGFVYSSWPARAAAADFVDKLRGIVHAHGDGAVISVILDGENAWEHYPENGLAFLRELYRAINSCPEIELATFSEVTEEPRQLERVHAGSWIYGSFSTWIGHHEKNSGWELLGQARRALAQADPALEPDTLARARHHLDVAQGSDWFWWYGDDHHTPLAGEFDGLFRGRLIAMCRELGVDEPPEFHTPIKQVARLGLTQVPGGYLSPIVDGRRTSFFEWRMAGTFDLGFDAGAMHQVERRLRVLRFGSDGESLCLCVEGSSSLEDLKDSGAALELVQGDRVVATVAGGPGWGKVIEVKVPFSALERDSQRCVGLHLRLTRRGALVERAPLYQEARFCPEPGRWAV